MSLLSSWAGRELWQLWDGEGHHSDCPEPRQSSQRPVHTPQVAAYSLLQFSHKEPDLLSHTHLQLLSEDCA